MAYRVRIDSFEGPFDLLLYLVSRKKVDIGSINIAEIADQYLAEVSALQVVDLDVASDFLLVAATLLEIKAQSLIPQFADELDEDLAELEPNEARELLVERLITYKTYKNAAVALGARYEAEGKVHARPFGPDLLCLNVSPDYLKDVSLDSLALLAAEAFSRQDVFLLESEHIAAKPIPVEIHVRAIHRRIRNQKHLHFSDLVSVRTPPEVIVVTFLAVLELYKRQMVRLEQPKTFGDIAIDYIEESGPLVLDDEPFLFKDESFVSEDEPLVLEGESAAPEQESSEHELPTLELLGRLDERLESREALLSEEPEKEHGWRKARV